MGNSRSKTRAAPAYAYRNNEFWGDMAAWNRQHSEDNSDRMERLRRKQRRNKDYDDDDGTI